VITHPEKVLFPEDGITKGELAAYYESVAPIMVPLIRGRPVTMERYPSGIGAGGFMQKNVSRGFPAWLERATVPKKGGVVNYPVVRDTRDLLWLANQNCITPHVWTSRVPELEHPDICVFDLDPSENDAEVLRAATLAVRDVLAEVGLGSWVKTSGSKGFHVVASLDGRASFDEVVAFAHAVAGVLVQRDPEHLTLEFIKADRGGRIYLDVGRNTPGATVAAPYGVRPRRGAPVSAPCTWEEVERGDVHPQSFTLRTMADRLSAVGDLWRDMHESSLVDPKREIERLGGTLEVPVIRRFGSAATARSAPEP
jgi:bifunctional non-homologous end joining protein LigD